MNRRSFIQRCFAGVAGVYAAFLPGKKKSPIITANGIDKIQKWEDSKGAVFELDDTPFETPRTYYKFDEPIMSMFEYNGRLIILTEGSAWEKDISNDKDFKKIEIDKGNLVLRA